MAREKTTKNESDGPMDSNAQVAADLLDEYGFHEQAEKLRKPPLLKHGTEFRVEGEEHVVFYSGYLMNSSDAHNPFGKSSRFLL